MMAKFQVSYTVEDWYHVDIEADSAREAIEKFYAGDFDDDNKVFDGGILQDSVTAAELQTTKG